MRGQYLRLRLHVALTHWCALRSDVTPELFPADLALLLGDLFIHKWILSSSVGLRWLYLFLHDDALIFCGFE